MICDVCANPVGASIAAIQEEHDPLLQMHAQPAHDHIQGDVALALLISVGAFIGNSERAWAVLVDCHGQWCQSTLGREGEGE